MTRLDIYSNYKISFMLTWIYIFLPIPIVSVFLFVFSNLYLIAILLIFVYILIGLIAFYIGYKKSKKLNYRYIIFDDDFFEIEDKYGNYIKADKSIIYPSKCGPIGILFYTLSLSMVYNNSFVDDDFSIDIENEKINCYISYKNYRYLKHLDYKYIFREL